MSFDMKATLTEKARRYRALCTVTGEYAWKIEQFSVGSQGFDPLDTTAALAPDPTASTLLNEVFRDVPDGVEWLTQFTPVFLCAVEQNEAVGQIGELGLWARVVNGPDGGELFLAGIVHIPVWNKTATDKRTFRIVLPA